MCACVAVALAILFIIPANGNWVSAVSVTPPVASSGTHYYVDFRSGSDTNAGTSPSTPWMHAPGDADATGVPAKTTLLPGDTVNFKGGVVYNGTITLRWSGSPGKPIIYEGNSGGTFGTGTAIIDGEGTTLGLHAHQYGFVEQGTWNGHASIGQSYVTINNFEIRDTRYIWNDTTGGYGGGPEGISFNGGTGSNITIENCWIHDIYPAQVAVNNNGMILGNLSASTSVHVTPISFTDSNVSLAHYAGIAGHRAPYKIFIGWGANDYTLSAAYVGPYWASNNTLRVYQDLNLTMPGWLGGSSGTPGPATSFGYSMFNVTNGSAYRGLYDDKVADIYVMSHANLTILDNNMSEAGAGIEMGMDNNTLIEGNSISQVIGDIVGGSGETLSQPLVNVTIAFNNFGSTYPYIKYCYWTGDHGDGIFFWSGAGSGALVRDVVIEGNQFRGYIPGTTALIWTEDGNYDNWTIIDNVFAAVGCPEIRMDNDLNFTSNVRIYNNDFVMVPLDADWWSMLAQGNTSRFELRNNVMWMPSGYTAVLSFENMGLSPLGSDYNSMSYVWGNGDSGSIGYNGTVYSLSQWVNSTYSFPHDKHSLMGKNPQFVNVPSFMSYLTGGGTLSNVTLTPPYPPHPPVNDFFRVGDRVEFDDDGIVRTVTAVSSENPQTWVEFTPALTVHPIYPTSNSPGGDFLYDWRNDTNFTLNLHIGSGSPLIGAGLNLAGQVPAIDADGSLRSLTAQWDIGAYAYAPVPPVSISSVSIEPVSGIVAPGGTLNFTAIPVCTTTCPPGVTFSWSFTNGLGTLNITTSPAVAFRAGNTTGTGALFVNATLNSMTKQSLPTPIQVTKATLPTLTSVTISPLTATIRTGQKTPAFTATPDCTTTCPSGTTYSWTLNNTALGSLNATTGSIVAFTAGTEVGVVALSVNATLNGVSKTSTAPAVITISFPSTTTLTSVAITPATQSVATGASTPAFTATPTCSTACPSTGISYSWASSKTGLGTLNSSSGSTVVFTAGTSAGSLALFVNATLNERTVQSSAAMITITPAVTNVTLTSVTISPTAGEVVAGGDLNFSAVTKCSSNPCPSGVTYAWTVNNTLGNLSVTTGNTTEFVAGNAIGTVVITVTATYGGRVVSNKANITIYPRICAGCPGKPSTPPPFFSGAVMYFTVALVAAVVIAIILLLLRKRKPEGSTNPAVPPNAEAGEASKP